MEKGENWEVLVCPTFYTAFFLAEDNNSKQDIVRKWSAYVRSTIESWRVFCEVLGVFWLNIPTHCLDYNLCSICRRVFAFSSSVYTALISMCGRYAVSHAANEYACHMAGTNKEALPTGSAPCANFGPGKTSVIITGSDSGMYECMEWNVQPLHRKPLFVLVPAHTDHPDHPPAHTGQRTLLPAIWGLIPGAASSAAPNPEINHFSMFNARAETLLEKPSFRGLVSRTSGRCIVSIDGFFEWKKLNTSTKQPFFVHIGHGPCLLAALYKTIGLSDGSGSQMTTYTVLTTSSCDSFRVIHDRQPIFLTPEQAAQWLHTAGGDAQTAELLMSLQNSQWDTNGTCVVCAGGAGAAQYAGSECKESDQHACCCRLMPHI